MLGPTSTALQVIPAASPMHPLIPTSCAPGILPSGTNVDLPAVFVAHPPVHCMGSNLCISMLSNTRLSGCEWVCVPLELRRHDACRLPSTERVRKRPLSLAKVEAPLRAEGSCSRFQHFRRTSQMIATDKRYATRELYTKTTFKSNLCANCHPNNTSLHTNCCHNNLEPNSCYSRPKLQR